MKSWDFGQNQIRSSDEQKNLSYKVKPCRPDDRPDTLSDTILTSVAADGQPSPETPVFELCSVRGTHRTHFQVSSQDCTSSTKIRTVSMLTDANFKVLLAINVQHIAINIANT